MISTAAKPFERAAAATLFTPRPFASTDISALLLLAHFAPFSKPHIRVTRRTHSSV
jgi:hypothetical protein